MNRVEVYAGGKKLAVWTISIGTPSLLFEAKLDVGRTLTRWPVGRIIGSHKEVGPRGCTNC